MGPLGTPELLVICGILLGLLFLLFTLIAVILAFTKQTKGWIITACACGFIVLLGIVGGATASYFGFQKAMAASTSTRTLTASEGNATLEIPSNWQTMKDLNEDACIQAGHALREEYAVVISEASDGFDGTLDDYSKIISNNMSQAMQGSKAGKIETLKLNGLDARRWKLTGTVEKLGITYIVTCVSDGANFHQVLCWTLSSRESRTMPVMTKVADSFRLKPRKP
jgi:hypothetical protein